MKYRVILSGVMVWLFSMWLPSACFAQKPTGAASAESAKLPKAAVTDKTAAPPPKVKVDPKAAKQDLSPRAVAPIHGNYKPIEFDPSKKPPKGAKPVASDRIHPSPTVVPMQTEQLREPSPALRDLNQSEATADYMQSRPRAPDPFYNTTDRTGGNPMNSRDISTNIRR